MGIVLAGGVAAGATYALFTSEAKTNISITSGTVSASAAINGLKIYSANPYLTSGEVVPGGEDCEYPATYYYEDRTASGTFIGSGTATITSGNLLTLDRMDPGDRVDANFVITNNSNVEVKYRLVAECTSTAEADLKFFSNLQFTALGSTKTNVRKYYTPWAVWHVPATAAEKVVSTDLKLVMPITLGNDMQDQSTNIALSVEMVQANAATKDSEDELLVFKSAKVEESTTTPSGMKDMTLTAGTVAGTVSDPLVKVEVPTGTTGEVKAAGDDVAVGDTLKLSVVEKEKSAAVVVQAGEDVKNYDVTLKNQNEAPVTSTNTKLKVSVFVGENKDILRVYHKDVEIPAYDGTNEGYVYENGYIVFYTDSFSPFSVVFADPFKGAGTEANPYLIENVNQWMKLVNMTKDDNSYKTTEGVFFKITSDIDVSEIETRAHVHYFAGSIDFDNHTLSGFNASNTVATDVNDDGLHGIFSCIGGNVTIKNLVFNTSLIVKGANKTAMMVVGRNKKAGSVAFENITINGVVTGTTCNNNGLLIAYAHGSNLTLTATNITSNVTMIGSGIKAALVGNIGYGFLTDLTFTNCVNNGVVVSTNSGAGMLVGNAACYGSTQITINIANCVNNGQISGIKASDLVVADYSDGIKTLVTINGSVTGNAGNVVTSSTLGTNEGKFVLTQVTDAVRYELQFSFSAGNHFGGTVGYTLSMTEAQRAVAEINVWDWIDLGDATEEVIAHTEYGDPYYTSGNHYVFNEEGADFRDPVVVLFSAYNQAGALIGLATYTYPNMK